MYPYVPDFVATHGTGAFLHCLDHRRSGLGHVHVHGRELRQGRYKNTMGPLQPFKNGWHKKDALQKLWALGVELSAVKDTAVLDSAWLLHIRQRLRSDNLPRGALLFCFVLSFLC